MPAGNRWHQVYSCILFLSSAAKGTLLVPMPALLSTARLASPSTPLWLQLSGDPAGAPSMISSSFLAERIRVQELRSRAAAPPWALIRHLRSHLLCAVHLTLSNSKARLDAFFAQPKFEARLQDYIRAWQWSCSIGLLGRSVCARR